ncbi:MAG: hypothetical protein AB7N71_15145, partial [Phycisphaerae bacterium]
MTREEARNAKVVTALVTCMTMGAIVLFALQPAARGVRPNSMLSASGGPLLSSAVIDFAPVGHRLDLTRYDCVVFSDGELVWQPLSPDIRIAIVGNGENRIPDAQARDLLAALGSMRYSLGLRLTNLSLDEASDPSVHPELPPQ